jgi:hypothetical protein
MNTRHTNVPVDWLDLYQREHIEGGEGDSDSAYIHVETIATLAEVSYHTSTIAYILTIMLTFVRGGGGGSFPK